jgi:osmotically-inducible protein OsmY
MKIDTSFKAVFASMMIVSGLAACDNPGPAEKAGKKVDQVTENVSNSVSNAADKADQAVTKQINSAGQAIDDATITTKVKSALLNEPGMKSMTISVDTEKGIVTLSGKADTQVKIDKAIKLAEAVEGVQSVSNKLVVSK